ncbi:IS630 family transposase [Deinococcus altitudinis]|uniref:IS630 family transposase n=1 Tax=Deinococcus altitudinis TaxID=468914 RepID=UPI0038919967
MTDRWLPSRLTRAQLEECRLHFLHLLETGQHSSKELAELLGVSMSTLRTWKHLLRHQGPGALRATVTTGRVSALSGAQRDTLKRLLNEGAQVHGFPDASWTTPRVREVIGRHFDIWHHRDHVRRILHQLGFSRQKPDKRALEQNPEAVATWIQTTLPENQKKVAAGATLVFLDEVGFSLKGTVKHTWALRGQTPVVFGKASWDKVSTIGAVTTAGQFLQHTQHGAFKGPDVIRFLQHVLTHVPGEIVVVLDNAGIHKSKAVTAFAAGEARLALRYLPPYAPELNPIELVWAYIKRNVLGNFCARTLQELKARLKVGWQRVRYVRLPDRLLHGYLPS